MRRKWMRTFSVLLIVCLLVSDNCWLDWKTTAYATEDTKGALTEDTVGSGSSSQPEEGKTQAGGSTSGEGEGGDSTGGSGSTGEGGNTGNNGNTSESGSTGEGGNTGNNENTSESGSTGEGGNTGNNENTSESGSTGEGENTGDSENPEEDEEDVPEEDEELTEDEIALYAEETESQPLKEVADEAEYQEYYKKENTYYIAKAEDFLLLQKLTQSYDFEGIRFQIGTTGSEKVWKISDISGFEGFGSADHPFRGKMSCYYASGFQFELDKPLFAYLGEGAEIYQFDFTCVDGASAAIAKNIQVSGENTDEIKIHDIDITGVIKNTGENVGIIVGSIGDNAKIYITNVNSGINNITGKNAGGIAGSLGDNVTITAENSSWTAAEVTGTAAAGGYFGVVTGSYTWNTSELTLCQSFKVQDGEYAGQFAGKLCKGTRDSKLTVTGDDTITIDAKVNGGQTVGGLLGFCEEGTTLEVEKPLTISGTVTASREQGSAGGLLGKVSTKITIKLDSYTGNATIETNNNNKGYAGGLFGDITSDFNLECKNNIAISGFIRYATGAGGFAGRIEGVNFCVPTVTVSATMENCTHVGGILGYLNKSKSMVETPKITAGCTLKGDTATGGIVGTVQNGSTPSALALDGRISVQPDSLSGGSCGALVGSQSESLIYLTGVEGIVDGASQLDLNDVAKNLEEIGQYGGVFRNQAEGDQKLIGGDGSLEQLGTVNGYAVSGSGSTWTLKGTAGMETLAIALNTQGNFGMEAFGSSSPNQSGIPTLLSGTYTLDGDADISYETTGIITVNRNDKENDDADKQYLFQGSLKGGSGSTTITQTSSVKQGRTGIFSTLGGTTSFSDLTITGTIENAKGTGGIAYQSKGEGMTLSGVQLKKTFKNNSDTIGGVLAKESSETLFTVTASNVTLASVINAGNVNEYSGFITRMENAKVALDGITLGGNLTTTSGGNCGGFLGHTWQTMQGNMKNVTVDSAGAAIDSKGSTGALLFATDTAEGQYLTLEGVDLKGLMMKTGAKSAFLAAYGQALAANVVDYSCKGATVDTAGEFDEIVYRTKDGNYTGIVSLHDSTKKHDSTKSFPKYCYTNQAKYTNQSPKTNQLTVYYYDLFQTINADGTINHARGTASKITSHELDTPEKMLIWSAVHNATSTPKSVFKKCFGENDYGNESYTLKGNLDLGNVSFYPASTVKGASLTGTNDATVKFHADQMDTTMGQHQGLHAGLLYNPTGGVTAKDFTLEGTVANLDGNNSGALISGTLTGGGTFENLTLKNLWVRDFNKVNDGDGLLISRIAAGTGTQTTTVDVTFNGISMTDYTNANTGVGGKKAAAALIGAAGGSNVTNLKLQFRNMQIADDADTSQASPKHNGDVLAFASFLYNYNFATNSDQNIGRGLYTFNEDEAGKKVTWGAELDSLTEYWVYEGTDPHKKVKDDKASVITNAENGYYKPYVYQTQHIEVNPKTGDLLKGCGTYEDPYIIESSQQFLTLYRYLSMKKGEKSDFFNDWKVNKAGSNGTFCTGNTHTQYTFTSADTFPTTAQRELSAAYYRLAADIDLSGITSGTYKVIADSFTGFGTSEIPFTGVWYGKDEAGSIHKITLPSKTSSQAYTVYGFIQYAKGAVVKDMEIVIPTKGTTATRTMIANGGAAGGVIGCILGGDNVIDHVKITGEFALQAHSGTITFAAAGAYAGMVKRGGLILRNVTLQDDLGAFKIYGDDGTEITGTTKIYTTYFAGALCGKVEDGYVLYEGDNDSTSAIWNKGVKAGHGNLSLIPYYDIVNGAYLDAQFKDSPATITEPKAGQITVTLPNAAALQVMSMALNADALNMVPNATKSTMGYTELSRSRRADYDKLGTKDRTESDYQKAVTYDDKASYPYLYKYLGITEKNYTTYILDKVSILNPLGKVNGTTYHTTWQLAKDETYDLTVFGQAFRGIGSLYNATDNTSSTFRGNFDGNGSTVKYALQGLALDYTKNTTVGTAFPASSGRRGLFNTMTGYKDESCYEPAGFTIQNLKLAGSIKIAGYAVLTVDAGGVVAYVNNARVTLSNIEVTEDFQINAGDYNKYDYHNGKHSTGGLIGRVVNNKQNLTIRNCKVIGTTGKPVRLTSLSHIGGFIGYVDLGSTDGELLIENTETDAAIDNLQLFSTKEIAGAVVGYMYRGKLTIRGTENKPVTVQNTTVQGWWNVGGIVGETKEGVLVTGTYLTVKDTTLTSRKATGGIIGEYGAYTVGTGSTLEHVKITDVKVQEASASDTANYDNENGQGGVVGKCRGYLTLKDVTVSTAEPTDSSKECKIAAVANNRVDVDGREKGVGGLAGAVTSKAKLTLNNCTVSHITVAAEKGNAKTTNMNFPVSAGGAVGYSTGTILVDGTLITKDVTVTTYTERAALGDKTREQVKHFSAGGVVGCLRGKLTTTSNDYVSTITAESNTVTGMYAGGFAGTVASYDSSDFPIKLQGKAGSKLVDGGTVTGGQAAGGLFGQLGMSTGSLYLNPEKGTTPLVVSGVTVSGMDAGGVAGSISASKDTRIENVRVEGCTITAFIPKNGNALVAGGSAAGGFVGACSLTGTLKLYNSSLKNNKILYQTDITTLQEKECGSEENFLSVGGVIGTVRSNAGTGTIQADNLVLSADNQLGVRQRADGKVQLIQKKGSSYQLADVAAPTGATNQDALNNLVDSYGLFVGTVIGTLNSTNITINMMNLQLSQDNLPVVDVGRTGIQSSYAYRQNCHILYGDEKSDTAQGNLARMKKEVKNSIGTYHSSSTDIPALLSYYRLNQVGDWSTGNTPQTPEAIWQDVYPLTLDVDGVKKEIPILVCKPGARSLNETITALSDIMTNVSGLSSSKMDILTVTAKPKKWNVTQTDAKGYNGEAADSGVKPHIAVTESGSGYTFAYLDSTPGSGEELFDQYDKTSNTLTYTELTYTYQWSDGSGEHKRVYVLPIFVEEPLQVDVKMSIQAGRVNSVEAMKKASKGSVVMANDSDSTLLLEYTYGKARKSYAEPMPKKIWMTEGTADSPRKYSEGTKLLLIDVTGGNKPYYYTVSSSTGDQISFTEFTDSTGSPYQEKLINREGFDGTEQFLLQTIRGDNQVKVNTIYDIHTGICDLDGELQNKIQGTLEAKIAVDSIPGITITLMTSDHKTNVEGKLTANGELVYTMQFSITAEQAYWQKENTIDSANNNKYLDLACYLMDAEKKERVPLPAGTNFQYRLEDGSSYSDLQMIPDRSGIYYYKAVRDKYGKEDSKFLIRGVDENGKTVGVTKDTTLSLQVKFKLPGELTGLSDSHYTACIDLLRTDDPDYPSGYEDALGKYRKVLDATVVPDIGFAVQVAEADWEKLGINTYESLDQIYEIPFTVQMDFREILRYASGEELLNQWAAKDYCMTFEIFNKAKDKTYGTTPFRDSKSFTDQDGNQVETMQIRMAGGANTWMWDGSAYAAVDAGSYADSRQGELTMKYRFSKDQLEKTKNGKPITLTGTLLVDGRVLRQLSTKAEFEKYLTNYRMNASLKITEASDSLPTGNVDTYDYFVYTITRLKIDM